jgi:hypothetical protein
LTQFNFSWIAQINEQLKSVKSAQSVRVFYE